MIPADVANRLRLITPDQPAAPQPVAPVGKLQDVLSNLVPGQRVLAEIQALLPNGSYRAVVTQREIVLALPFSAKAGDALELEVVESEGKLGLAFVAHRNPGSATALREETSFSTSLSQTGKLIGNLFGHGEAEDSAPRPVPLRGNQPLFNDFPKDTGEVARGLKSALTQSGMFYEAHQAQWVEGKLTIEALLQEPQGKFSTLPRNMATGNENAPAGPETEETLAASSAKAVTELPGRYASNSQAALMQSEDRLPAPVSGTASDTAPQALRTSRETITPELAPLVRQQLDALATQNHVWQGSVWPGQEMRWEIEKDRDSRREGDEGPGQQWQTHLKLELPGLGTIEATMRLQPGGAIDIRMLAAKDVSRAKIAAAGDTLCQQFEAAGLSLTALAVQHGTGTD